MIRFLSIATFLCTTIMSWSQIPDYTLIRGAKPTVKDTIEHRSRFSVGVSVTPEMNSIFTEGNIGTEGVSPRMGATFGINFGFVIRPSFTIRTGVYYGRKKYGHIHNGLVFPQDLIGPEPTTSSMESQVQYSIFHLPIILQVNPGGKQFFFAAGLGWDYQHYATAQQHIFFGNGEEDQLPEIKKPSPNFSSHLSFGYALKASDKVRMLFEPIFKIRIRDFIIAGSNLYNIGMRVTLNFNL